MLDRMSEMLELILVRVGMAMGHASDEQKKMITLFLGSLLFAAVVANVLQATLAR